MRTLVRALCALALAITPSACASTEDRGDRASTSPDPAASGTTNDTGAPDSATGSTGTTGAPGAGPQRGGQ